MRQADLILLGASQVVTMDGGRAGPKRGARDMNRIGIIEDAGIAIRRGRIVAIDHTNVIAKSFRAMQRVFCRGRAVLPGFVDPHSHPVFARPRVDEFAMRCRGADYEEILEAGGGIHASARAVRDATLQDLAAQVRARLDGMLKYGIVALEGKSGYGLTQESELKSLQAMRSGSNGHPIELVRTFLGAHVIPEEYKDRRRAYVKLLTDEMIPRVAKRKLARFCDVFVERGAFGINEARLVLQAGKRHGLRPKVHADQFRDGGAAKLAASVKAISAEHLDATKPAGIRALAQAKVIAVLLPTAGVFTGLKQRPNARKFIDAGCAVALSTDFNPGTSPTENITLAASFGCTLLGMTPEEAICAITRNAAAAAGLEDRYGRLAVGRRADFVIIDAPSYEHIPYRMGTNLVQDVYVAGRPVVRRGTVVRRKA